MFAICTIARCNEFELKVFLEHYLKLGPEKIYLFWDCRHEKLPEFVKDIISNIVVLNKIDNEVLETHGLDFSDVQRFAYASGFKLNQSPWLFFCDIDEFLYCDIGINTFLNKSPIEEKIIRILNVEAIWTRKQSPFDAYSQQLARLSTKYFPNTRNAQIQEFSEYELLLTTGLMGYHQGKHFLRREADVSVIGAHRSIVNNSNEEPKMFFSSSPRLFLVHYDAISFDQFKEKCRRVVTRESKNKFMSEKRLKIFENFEEADEKKYFEFFKDHYTIMDDKVEILKEKRLIIDIPQIRLTSAS